MKKSVISVLKINSRYLQSPGLDMKCNFRLFFQQSVALWEILRLLDGKEFLGMSAGVRSDDQGISGRFLRTVLLSNT